MKTAAVMSRNVVVVSPAVTVGAAAALMHRLRIRHLPVVDDERLAGIVSDRDLMRHGDQTTCAEAMTPSPVVCSPDAPISRVVRLMLDNKIDSVPVVDGGARLLAWSRRPISSPCCSTGPRRTFSPSNSVCSSRPRTPRWARLRREMLNG